MQRVTKDPETRKTEIMDTAEQLFVDRGFQDTQISDIVKVIGVAQGTFYYYFKSKEEVVEAIIRRKIMLNAAEIERISETLETAPQKLEKVLYILLSGNRSAGGLLFESLYNDEYLHIIERFAHHANELFAQSMKKIVSEGVAEGYFKVDYPEEMVDFILAIIRCMFDSLYKSEGNEKVALRLETAQKLINAALGSSKCILRL